jgi:putative membrane protein
MLTYLFTTLVTALGLLVVDLTVPGVDLHTFTAAIFAAVAIGLVNQFIKPILSVLSFPATFLSFGAFALVVNGICFWMASWFVPGFVVHGFLGFIIAPVVLSLASTFLHKYLIEKGFGKMLGSKTADLPELEASN